MFESSEVPQTLTGRGIVSAEGCDPVRIRYRVLIERTPDGIRAHGTLHGHHAGLRPVWLEPDAQLRLKNGRRLDIALTDLVGDVADFESVGPIDPI